MTAEARIERLRRANPAAVELAAACALAARVEPPLLRGLRLLVATADAAAEADLWFSDLLAGRDATAMALDPLVAEVLRNELRRPERARLRTGAREVIAAAHADAHWSVRLEEHIHYLDTERPDGADELIDDLLLAALDQLRSEPDPRGVARWLMGAVGRLPRQVGESLPGRAATAAAMLHLDRQAPAPGLLHGGEAQAWLPWVAVALPTVDVPVRLLDGAVVLGAAGQDAVLLPGVPDTDPLVVEVRWTGGRRARGRLVRFRIGDPVQVETGTRAVTLVTIAGASHDLAVADDPAAVAPAGLNFDDVKARLRPCLGRAEELDEIRQALADPDVRLVGVAGRPGSGTSTLLLAAADAASAAGTAVVEHFFGVEADQRTVERSLLAQLEAAYPDDFAKLSDTDLGTALDNLAVRGAFRRRPLTVLLDGTALTAPVWQSLQRAQPGAQEHLGVHYLVHVSGPVDERAVRVIELSRESDAAVCRAMISRERPRLEPAFVDPVLRSGPSTGQLAAGLHDLMREPIRSVRRRLGPALRSATGVNGDLNLHPNRSRVEDALARWARHVDDDDLRAVVLGLFLPERRGQTRVRPETVVQSRDLDNAIYLMAEAAGADIVAGGALAVLADELPAKLATLVGWVSRQPPATVTTDTIPPVLTVRWPAVLEELSTWFERWTPRMLDILRAAHNRNTWQDCADLPPPEGASWPEFWHQCVLERLVGDVPADGLVRLLAPEAADLLLDPDRPGDRLLGLREDTPLNFARTASPTRLAAAVTHELARNAPEQAYLLCTDLNVVHRRYAEDVTGLLADLADLAALAARRQDARSWDPVDPATLRSVVQDLAEDGTSPADFALALRDRLVERGTHLRFATPWSMAAPLRVRAVVSEQDLRDATQARAASGRALAIARMTNVPISTPSAPDGVVLITQAGLTTMDGEVLISGWRDALGASRGAEGGFALWTANTVWTDTMLDSVAYDGPIDFAVRLAQNVAVAGEDGGVTVLSMPATGGEERLLPGHGACVTAIVDLGRRVLASYEDGAVRSVPSAAEPAREYAAHRGIVRCLAATGANRFVSGGADGCLLLWDYDNSAHPVARWQGDRPVTCLAVAGNTIAFGTADGKVRRWQPVSGSTVTLADHGEPVRGIAVTESMVVSWASSVSFWTTRRTGELVATATGFSGGVRDIIVTSNTYTALCVDGSVEQRALPRTGRANGAGRTCLGIADGEIYAGLDRTLVRLDRSGATRVGGEGPYLRAAPVGAGIAALRGRGISIFAPSGGMADVSERAELIAPMAGRWKQPRFITSAESSVAVRRADVTRSGVRMSFGDRSIVARHQTPDTVTSLASSPSGDIAAGLANGETCLFTADGGHRTLVGGSPPVTAVAILTDGSVVSAASDGAVHHWHPGTGTSVLTGPAHAVTAMAVAGSWLITGNTDGALVLWSGTPPRPVHTVRIGSPVVALAADAPLVAARDSQGRLWTLSLDHPETRTPAPELRVVAGSLEGRLLLEFRDPSFDPYELVAVRASVGGQPVGLTVSGHWPHLEPDGELTVPFRPAPDEPLRLVSTASDRPGQVVSVTAEIASPQVRGYRTTRSWGISRGGFVPLER